MIVPISTSAVPITSRAPVTASVGA